MVHQLKTWPEYFNEVWHMRKLFEIRKNDRNFNVGDKLKLLEYNPKTETYTGRYCLVKVNYILKEGFGLKEGFCIMSISFQL